jgi:hypothetical protein
MRLVIAIFGLLGTLSAQDICRPVDAKGGLDYLFETKTNATADLSQRFTEYVSHPVRCFEQLHGTFGLGNGKIVHSLYLEIKPVKPFTPMSLLCPKAPSNEPFGSRTEYRSWPGSDKGTRPAISTSDPCKPTDRWPLATDN